MRIPNQLDRHGFGFNMTPMIDVVFLLIIFFLVSTELDKQENRMELDLADGMTGLQQRDVNADRLTINVTDQGEIFVNSTRMSRDQLTNLIGQELEKIGPDIEVRIRASRFVPYGEVSPIMAACAQRGIWDVKYAIVEDRE